MIVVVVVEEVVVVVVVISTLISVREKWAPASRVAHRKLSQGAPAARAIPNAADLADVRSPLCNLQISLPEVDRIWGSHYVLGFYLLQGDYRQGCLDTEAS